MILDIFVSFIIGVVNITLFVENVYKTYEGEKIGAAVNTVTPIKIFNLLTFSDKGLSLHS